MRFLRIQALLALSLLLGACAVPMRISLTPEQRASIKELQAHVVVVQDEVLAAVQPSNVSLATGGGLIGAMIDSSITNSRVKASQEIMGPFYASIEDVDYRSEFNQAIRRELANYPIKVSQFTTTPRALGQADLGRLRATLQPGQSLLVIAPRYFLTMDFRTLDAEAVVSMWVKGGQDNTPVQRGVLYYQSQPVGPGGKESIALWSAQNAAAFRAALRESITETIHLVLMDMDVRAPAAKPDAPASFAFNTGAQQGQIKGQLIKETAQRATVLGEDKKLYSLPKMSQAAAAAAQ
jgi:hypothetical protein